MVLIFYLRSGQSRGDRHGRAPPRGRAPVVDELRRGRAAAGELRDAGQVNRTRSRHGAPNGKTGVCSVRQISADGANPHLTRIFLLEPTQPNSHSIQTAIGTDPTQPSSLQPPTKHTVRGHDLSVLHIAGHQRRLWGRRSSSSRLWGRYVRHGYRFILPVCAHTIEN